MRRSRLGSPVSSLVVLTEFRISSWFIIWNSPDGSANRSASNVWVSALPKAKEIIGQKFRTMSVQGPVRGAIRA